MGKGWCNRLTGVTALALSLVLVVGVFNANAW